MQCSLKVLFLVISWTLTLGSSGQPERACVESLHLDEYGALSLLAHSASHQVHRLIKQNGRELKETYNPAAQVSLGAAALPEIALEEQTSNSTEKMLHSDEARERISKALEEAAMAEAALAVAAEAAAAKAAGGGPQGRLLASTRLADTISLEDEAVTDQLQQVRGQVGHRGLPAAAAPNGSQVQWKNPFAGYSAVCGGRWYNSGLYVVVVGSLAVVTCVASAVLCCGFMDDDVDSDSADSDDDGEHFMNKLGQKKSKDQVMKELMGKGSKKNRFCCGICWCCSRNVLFFFILALLFTFFGGCLLWKTGILQPLLAQLILIAYIFCLVMAFVAVLLWEATAAYREATAFIFGRLHAVEDVIPWFGRRLEKKEKKSPGLR